LFFFALLCHVALAYTQMGRRACIKMNSNAFEESLIGNTDLAVGTLPRERYIATNRFNVRKGAMPKFEKRWADRKSRLATLDGFKFFTLLKRVEEFDADYSNEGDKGNYVSWTIWGNKDAFDTWRAGDAFKEAHGGGGITGFIGLLTTALFILEGGPKPAFYDGLISRAGEQLNFKSEGGWRIVPADGVNFLPVDCFMAQNRYEVKAGREVEFESHWKALDDSISGVEGFVGFFVQRRDASKADDGYNYITSTIWKSKESFKNWKEQQTATAGNILEMCSAKPVPAYYEGKLALNSASGM